MTFTVILLALFAERFLVQDSTWRRADWLQGFIQRVAAWGYGDWLLSRYWGVLALLTLPLLLVALIQDLFGDALWNLPQFAFALLVLLYCLGPEDLDNQVVDYLDSEDRGDTDKACGFAERICGGPVAEEQGERIGQLTEAVLTQAQRRLFGVVFWFFLLGPLGAVLYRLSVQIQQQMAADAERELFNQGAARLLHILDWLPARLVLFSFALVGNYEGTLQGRAEWGDRGERSAESLLLAAGRGSLGIAEGPAEAQTTQVEAVMGLVWRALTLWLALFGLLAISL